MHFLLSIALVLQIISAVVVIVLAVSYTHLTLPTTMFV